MFKNAPVLIFHPGQLPHFPPVVIVLLVPSPVHTMHMPGWGEADSESSAWSLCPPLPKQRTSAAGHYHLSGSDGTRNYIAKSTGICTWRPVVLQWYNGSMHVLPGRDAVIGNTIKISKLLTSSKSDT